MKILVACEFSGIVREAFRARGHDAWSCDFLPSEIPSFYHLQSDVFQILYGGNYRWDLMIAFPPCTHLAVSGARWFKDKHREQREALRFVRMLMDAPVKKIAIENPVSVISTKIRKPDQIIHPWQFGEQTTKATCLWLKGLPKLISTEIVTPTEHRVWREPPSPHRWKNRSRTYPGIADAMAEQWG